MRRACPCRPIEIITSAMWAGQSCQPGALRPRRVAVMFVQAAASGSAEGWQAATQARSSVTHGQAHDCNFMSAACSPSRVRAPSLALLLLNLPSLVEVERRKCQVHEDRNRQAQAAAA